MWKIHRLGLFIGRMSLPHQGHFACIDRMAEENEQSLILVGSSYRSISIKNPFTFDQRSSIVRDYISSAYGEDEEFFDIQPLEDNPYCNNAWIHEVQEKVRQTCKALGWHVDEVEVTLYHGEKESPDSYHSFFPDYKKVAVPSFAVSETVVHATDLRKALFEGQDILGLPLSRQTLAFLNAWMRLPVYSVLKEDYDFVKKDKKSWEAAPYAPTFVTVDACVVQSGYIALIQRRNSPGKGLWALPGGFLNQEEKIFDGCIRELIEETGIKVPEKVLRASLVKQEVFDDPNRSSRGRTITHAFKFQLKDELELPHIKGMDDAIKAKWVPIWKIFEMRDQMFEDHYFIIRSLMGF